MTDKAKPVETVQQHAGLVEIALRRCIVNGVEMSQMEAMIQRMFRDGIHGTATQRARAWASLTPLLIPNAGKLVDVETLARSIKHGVEVAAAFGVTFVEDPTKAKPGNRATPDVADDD